MEEKKINKLSVGQFYEKEFIVSENVGEAYAKISQDYNPIHLDSETAQRTRFKKKIVHGMLIGSYISGVIGNEFPGAGSVYISQEIIFKRPVYYNTKIIIRVEVAGIDSEKGHVLLKTQCYDMDNKTLVDGNAKILLE